MDLITLASKLHPTIWGVVLGSSLTLFGTYLQGRMALKLLLKQKAIENNIRKENRDYDLKKDNFLNCLKGMNRLVNVFMDFTNPGRDFEDFSRKIQELFIELSLNDLIADKETLEPMHKFQKYYFQVCMDLINDKIPYETLIIDQNSKNEWYNYYAKRIEENIALINNNPHNGTESEKEYQKYLNDRYNELSKERDKYSNELNELRQRLLNAEMDFKRIAVEKVIMISQFLNEFIQSARKELGLPQYVYDISQVNAFNKNVRTSIEKTFAAVKALV